MSEVKKILLVDDDDDFLLQQKMILEKHGFTVNAAGSRNDAEKLMSSSQPDIAIIDVMMEEADGGFILAHHIKKLYPRCPIIMVTGVSYETGIEFTASPKDSGGWVKADAVLAKPVSADQLLREIQRLTA
jgi:two-component system OmpR family response regulator